MPIKKHPWLILSAAILGFFWSYSFSTRIGLLFFVPLWLKILVLGGMTINFSLLGWHLVRQFLKRINHPKRWLQMIAIAVMLSVLFFVIIPYQRIPFRTVHHLEITAVESEVKLKAVYSPDDNLIYRDEFLAGEGVDLFAEMGFRIPSGQSITYQRAQTGGLKLLFTIDSGPANVKWDQQEYLLDPTQLYETRQQEINGWDVASDITTNALEITLPGNTWGQPDLFWTILGGLLPISDFVALSSIFVGLIWFAMHSWEKRALSFPKSKMPRYWIDAMLIFGLIMVLIHAGFPDFLPFWFLLLFLPTILYLAYQQVSILTKMGEISLPGFKSLQVFIKKIGGTLIAINQNPKVFWAVTLLIAVASVFVQRNLTAPGMGISGDSVHYLQGAQNLAAGKGYVLHIVEGDPVPITGFEPAYSMLIALGIFLGGEAEPVARILNAILLFLTVLTSGMLIFKTTGKVIPALVGDLLLLMAPAILSIFAWVMSEPLFIFLMLANFFSLAFYIKSPSNGKALITGLLTTLMMITRLAGAVFLPPIAIAMLAMKGQKFKERIRHTFIWGLTSLTAPAAFLVRNHFVSAASAESQGLQMASFPKEYWEIIGSEVSSWFKWQAFFNLEHQRFNAMFASLGLILILFIIWLVFRKGLNAHGRFDPLTIVLFIAIPVYTLAIVLNTILLTPEQTVSGLTRYMIPVFILSVILICKLLNFYWKQPFLFPKIAVLLLLFVGFQLYFKDFSSILKEQPVSYRHYTDRKNECGDEIIQFADDYPEQSFYSNSCEYFFFITGKRCRYLPYGELLYQPDGEMDQAIQTGDLVAFTDSFGSDPPGIRPWLKSLERLESACYIDFYRWPEE